MALSDLTPPQRALADFMSLLSERAYRAGWMEGIEHELWEAMRNPASRGAPIWLAEEEARMLEELSAQCGGWIAFDDVREEMFVPLAAWEARFGVSPGGAP